MLHYMLHAAIGLRSEQFARFSKFATLRRAVANLIVKVKDFKGRCLQTCEDGDLNSRNPQQSVNPHTIQLLRHALSVEDLDKAETVMIKGPDTPDAIRQRGAIFRFSLIDKFDPGLSFSNI
jgi:hypothetical protein